MKKEIPMLLSTVMVQATLEDRKSNTRRLKALENVNNNPDDWDSHHLEIDNQGKLYAVFKNKQTFITEKVKCPYGKPSDMIWVREKHRKLVNCETGSFHCWDYYADMPEDFRRKYPHNWKPSIHMPKAAARIWLEVTDIKVERLQDISEQDAIAEGIEKKSFDQFGYGYRIYTSEKDYDQSPVVSFMSLWEKINGYDSWQQNPWVWVISFKVLSKTGRP